VPLPEKGETALPSATEILAALPFAVLVIDQRGEVRNVNASAEQLLNASANSLIGKALITIIDLPSTFEEGGGGPFAAFDVELTTKRVGQIRCDLHATPLVDHPGWQMITIAHARDKSHGALLEHRSNSRAAIAVAAMLAHEIKNPLSGIRGAAQLLDGRVAEADAPMTLLIQREVDRVAALIDRMEGFTDTRSIDLSAQNIHAIIDHSRRVAEQGFGDKLVISEEYDPSLPPVLAHEDSLIQVIINLLKNAAETSDNEEKRHVLLMTRYRHGVVLTSPENRRRMPLPIELCVIDDGPGAPDELVEQLFDPFISSKRKGQGLGLALADKLVRDMGGIIQYAREGSPPRTVFRLLLQRAEGETA
jgi:two-component system, NtrC family, nitrogen regulation sensor histidine kinase GlnL